MHWKAYFIPSPTLACCCIHNLGYNISLGIGTKAENDVDLEIDFQVGYLMGVWS
jgi:hypothetical protein